MRRETETLISVSPPSSTSSSSYPQIGECFINLERDAAEERVTAGTYRKEEIGKKKEGERGLI